MVRRVFAEEAPRYYAAGLNVLPIVPGTKWPPRGLSWRRWQMHRQTEDELVRLIEAHPEADVAPILGGPGALVDVETDGPHGEDALCALGIPVLATACFTSPRGTHRLYRASRSLPSRVGLRPGLDVLAHRRYVVAPTSTGREWLTPGGVDGVAPLPAEWEALLHSSRGDTPLDRVEHTGVEEGRRNTTLTRLVGRWLSQSCTKADLMARARDFARRCTPPLCEREVEQVVASVLHTRARTRSPERAALVLGRNLGLSATDRLVLVGLEAQRGELGRPAGKPFAAPVREVARLTGLSHGAVGNAYQRLRAAGVLRLEDGRTPDGRPVSLVVFTPPSTWWT